MFGKGKTASKVLEHNGILNQYDVGRLFGSGGPEGVWKIYEGMNKTDGRVSLHSTMINYLNELMISCEKNYTYKCIEFELFRKCQYLYLTRMEEVLLPIIP